MVSSLIISVEISLTRFRNCLWFPLYEETATDMIWVDLLTNENKPLLEEVTVFTR